MQSSYDNWESVKDINIQDAIVRWVRGQLSKTFHAVVSRRQFLRISVGIKQLMALAKSHLQQSQVSLPTQNNQTTCHNNNSTYTKTSYPSEIINTFSARPKIV